MTEQTPIGQEAAWSACQRALRAACDAAELYQGGRRMLGEALCATLDTVGGGAPEFTAFGDMRTDAAWWADLATPMELEIYAGAALRRIERATFAHKAKKRLLWSLWQSMTDQDRAAFLAAVTKEDAPP